MAAATASRRGDMNTQLSFVYPVQWSISEVHAKLTARTEIIRSLQMQNQPSISLKTRPTLNSEK